jgi:hypothetical protein
MDNKANGTLVLFIGLLLIATATVGLIYELTKATADKGIVITNNAMNYISVSAGDTIATSYLREPINVTYPDFQLLYNCSYFIDNSTLCPYQQSKTVHDIAILDCGNLFLEAEGLIEDCNATHYRMVIR